MEAITMTRREFCLVMAITIEAAEALPTNLSPGIIEHNDPVSECWGLCSVLSRGMAFELITREQEKALRGLLFSHPARKRNPNSAFFWVPGSWKPRARALRWMADQIDPNEMW